MMDFVRCSLSPMIYKDMREFFACISLMMYRNSVPQESISRAQCSILFEFYTSDSSSSNIPDGFNTKPGPSIWQTSDYLRLMCWLSIWELHAAKEYSILKHIDHLQARGDTMTKWHLQECTLYIFFLSRAIRTLVRRKYAWVYLLRGNIF